MANWWDKYEAEPSSGTPERAWWRKYEEDQAVEAKASARIGVPSAVGGEDVQPLKPLQAPMGGTLGAIQGMVGLAERGVDAVGSIDPAATAQSALGTSQQALGAAIRAPAETVQQGLGPLQLIMAAAGGDQSAIEALQDANTQRGIVEAGMSAGPVGAVAALGAGIQESGTRNVEEAAPRMLGRPENLLSPEGIAWALQQAAQSAGPMAIGALSSRFGNAAGVAPFVPAGAADTYSAVRESGGLPSEALGAALPRGGLEVVFESPVMQAAGAGRLARATLADIGGEIGTEAGNIGLDVAEGQALTREEARSRLAGAGIVGAVQGPAQTALSYPVARLPGKLGEGLAAAREMLARAGGVSDGRPDVAQPKANTAPYIDAPISIAPTSIDTVDTQITTGINTEEAKREGVNPAGVSKEREIPAKEDTLSDAPLSPVQETAPTPKMGAKEAVAVAMAESQDKAAKDPVYAEWANANRKERSEQIQARARELMEPVIGTGPVVSQNQSQTLPATPVAPPVSEAPVASQEAATSVPASTPEVTPAPAGQVVREVQTPVTSTQVPQVSNTATPDSIYAATDRDGYVSAVHSFVKTLPDGATITDEDTGVVYTVRSVTNQKTGAVTVELVTNGDGQNDVAFTTKADGTVKVVGDVYFPQKGRATITLPKTPAVKAPKVKKTPAPKPVSDKDALAQAFTELQTRSLNDPEFQKQVTANPSLMRQMATQRASEIVAQSTQTQQPQIAAKEAPETPVAPSPANFSAPKGWGSVEAGEVDPTPQENDNYIRSYVRTGKDALDAVASGAIKAPEPIRVVAKKLASISDFSDVPVSLSDNAEADGLINKDGEKAAGYYRAGNSNDVKLLSTTGGRTADGSEVIVHELAHAGTIKVMERLESGELNDPELKDLLDDMKLGLKELRRRLDAGEVSDPYNKVAYAAQDIYELVATVYADPRTARRLDEARVTIPRRGPRRGRIATVWQIIKDFITKYLGKYAGITPKEVEQVLLTSRIRETVERMSVEKRARQAKDTPKARKAYSELKALAPNAPNNIQPDKVTELPAGTTEERTIERFRGWSTRLLAPKGLGSTNAKQMGERSVGTANAMRLEGDVLSAKLSQQMAQHIAKILGDQPVRIQALYRYKIGEYLAGNTAVASDIPTDILETVEAMREILDNNTMRMIALGAINADDIPKMLNNLGRWIHRDFEVFHHEPGEFKRITQERAKAGNDPLAPLLDQVMEEMQLPEPGVIAKIGEMAGKKSGKGMKDWKADATKTLRELNGQPEPKKPKNKRLAVIRDEAEKYLRDMAAKWGIGRNTPLEGPDGIIARLSTLSANGTEDLQKAAARWANSLLDPTSMPIDDAPYVPSVLAIDDSSIDKKRTQVPPWLQELWGKFKDPNAMFLTSLDNQANIIAKFTALQEYKQRGMANGTVLENKAGMTDANMHPKGFMLLGSKDDQIHYGPLQNMWIKREDYDYLGITASQRAAEKVIQDSFFKGYLGLLSLVGQPAKMMLIALNHTSLALQTLSSLFLHSRSSPKRLAAGLKAARYTALGGTRFGKDISDEQLKKDVDSMISQGLLVNNALAGDARRKLREFIISPGEQFLSVPQRAMKKIVRGYGKLLDSAGRLMSIGDEAAKVMMVYARMEDLQSIHPDKSRQELLELATEHAMQTMPVQMREAPLARMAGNSGVIDAFAPWYAAMARNTYNHLKIADEYSKMPSKEAKKYAFTEMGLLAVKAYGAYYLAKSFQLVGSGLTYALAAGDDEEEIKAQAEAGAKAQKEKYEGIRGIAPEHTVGDFAVLREVVPDVYRVASFQRYDPMPIGALMSAAERGDEEEKANILNSFLFSEAPLVKALTTAIGYFPEAAASGVQDVYGNVDARALDARQAFLKGMQEVIAGVTVPGSVTSIQRQLDDPVDATPLETFLTNMGATVSTVDVRKRTGEIGADYLATLNRIKSGASREASSKDTLFSDASVDFKGDLLAKAEAWRFARKKVQYVQSLGKSDPWIKDAIKSNPYASSLSKEEITSLLTGRFVVPNYNKWLKEQRDTDLKDPKNSMRKEEVRAQYARYEQDLSKFYEGLQELLQKEGITKR